MIWIWIAGTKVPAKFLLPEKMQGINEPNIERLKLKIQSKSGLILTLLSKQDSQQRVKGLMSLKKMLVMFSNIERKLFREVEEGRNYQGKVISKTKYSTPFLSL